MQQLELPESSVNSSVDLRERNTDNGTNRTYECKNGVVLLLMRVKGAVVRQAASSIKKPVVPEVWMADKGRSEENPNDPDYLAALKQWRIDQGMAGTEAYLMFGSKIHSVPDGMQKEITEGDKADYQAIGIDVHTTGRLAYLDWLKYVVFDDDIEMLDCVGQIMRYSGAITEEMVKELEDSFPDNNEGGANTNMGDSQ